MAAATTTTTTTADALTLPPISILPSLPPQERAKILDLLFEPCTQLHTLSVESLAQSQPRFEDYAALVRHVRAQLHALNASRLESDREWLLAILAAHPRLGAAKVESAMSRVEQAQLQGGGKEGGSAAGGQEEERTTEAERLRKLNEEYEAKFPGLIYVTFVNSRPRTEIMQDMRKRIDSSTLDKEKEDAIEAMCDIALDRVKKLGAV